MLLSSIGARGEELGEASGEAPGDVSEGRNTPLVGSNTDCGRGAREWLRSRGESGANASPGTDGRVSHTMEKQVVVVAFLVVVCLRVRVDGWVRMPVCVCVCVSICVCD
jgi:hypothetical protein